MRRKARPRRPGRDFRRLLCHGWKVASPEGLAARQAASSRATKYTRGDRNGRRFPGENGPKCVGGLHTLGHYGPSLACNHKGMVLDRLRDRVYKVANRAASEEAWERFLAAERSMLEQRRRGSLAQALGGPLPGESPEELRWLDIEDRHLAEEGLVELRSGDEAWFKHVDDLTLEDRPARIEAEGARRAWLMERLTEAEGPGDRQTGVEREDATT